MSHRRSRSSHTSRNRSRVRLSHLVHSNPTQPNLSLTEKKAPHLIVCPLSVLSSWETVRYPIILPLFLSLSPVLAKLTSFSQECARWTPTLRLGRMHGARTERDAFKSSFASNQASDSTKLDIVLTTYETYAAEDRWFKHHAWMYCVLDEGHRIKGQDTQIRAAMDGVSSIYRLSMFKFFFLVPPSREYQLIK